MKWLLTNDDGFDAPGLRALEALAARFAEVVVIAPQHPMSGVGHAVTTGDALSLETHGANRFSLSGTPADCVRVGLWELAPDADWVIAGINAGGNLGADAYTSGTLAAAREGALLGRRSLALSQYVARDRHIDWRATERRAEHVLREVLTRPSAPATYWNANLPHPAEEGARCPIVEAPLDPSPMAVRYRRDADTFHWDGDYHARPRVPGSDVDVCFSGGVALSALPLRLPDPSD